MALPPPLNKAANFLAFRGPSPSRRFIATYDWLSIFPANKYYLFPFFSIILPLAFHQRDRYPFFFSLYRHRPDLLRRANTLTAVYRTTNFWFTSPCIFRSRSYCCRSRISQRMLQNQKAGLHQGLFSSKLCPPEDVFI